MARHFFPRRSAAIAAASLLAFSGLFAAHAQSGPAPAKTDAKADAKTRVVILGTQGGPIFNAKRAQPANAVVVKDRIYLVDAGNGVTRQLALAGLDYRRVQQIFITHNHDDHNADWGTLAGLQWSTGRQTPVNIYGPRGTEAMRDGFLTYFAPNASIRKGDGGLSVTPDSVIKAHDIVNDGVIFQDDLVKVTAVANCHYHFNPATAPQGEQPKSYAFRFETPDRVVVFGGDTGACDAMREVSRDADLLIHEVVSLPLMEVKLKKLFESNPNKPSPDFFAGLMRHIAADHTEPEDIGRLATAAKVKQVVLTHILPGSDDDPDDAYAGGVKKHFQGPVVVAADLMAF